MTLAGAIAVWIAVGLLAFLAWAALRGFDPSMCSLYGACPELRG